MKSYQLLSAPSFSQENVHITCTAEGLSCGLRTLHMRGRGADRRACCRRKMSSKLRLRFTQQQQQHNMQQHQGAGAPTVPFPLHRAIHSSFQGTLIYAQRYMYIDFSNSIYCTPSAHKKTNIWALFAFQQTAAFSYKSWFR